MISILIVGLDNAGKSSLVAHSKPMPQEGIIEISPTLGFSIEEITMPRGERGIVYDVSGAGRYRQMWDHFVGEVSGVVYVIDSTDKERLTVVKQTIHEFLKHPLLRKKPVVFLANKQDLPNALAKDQLKRLLALDAKYISSPFSVKHSKGTTGMGFNDALTFIETNQRNKLIFNS